MSEPGPVWFETDLTVRQVRILRYLSSYTGEHGWAPSFREIGAACAIPSTSIVAYHLRELARRGHIALGDGARTIRVIKSLDNGA